MSDAWRLASIRTFEQVPVGPSTGLFRVSAEGSPQATPDERPTLVTDDGHTVSRFVAIPAPPDPGSTLRAAYSVPIELVTPHTTFSLAFADGLVIDLSQPTPTPARLTQATGARRVASDAVLRRHSEVAIARAEQQAMRDLATHGETRDPRDRVEVAVRERAAEAETGHQQATARLTELETWSAELERRLADSTTELADARAEIASLGGRAPAPEPATAPAPRPQLSAAQLDEIRRAATDEAHAQAERDLAAAASPSRS